MSDLPALSLSKGIRSFIAVPVPPEAAGKLHAAQETLRRAAPAVKWVDPNSFHITLKFLGGVLPDRLQQTWQAVAAALPGAASFTMRFHGIGAFPSANRPRVIWAGLTDGAADLTALAARVEQACVALDFEPEARPFHPHLTLGRAREAKPDPDLSAAIARLAQEELGEVPVDRLLLMKSELTPRGAIYHVLQEYALL